MFCAVVYVVGHIFLGVFFLIIMGIIIRLSVGLCVSAKVLLFCIVCSK
jgi:hypothetical protein